MPSEIVRQIRARSAMRWGGRRIAGELDVSRGTVKRYLRGGAAAEMQPRPSARRLTDEQPAEVIQLFDTTAEGNAVVVQQLLSERGLLGREPNLNTRVGQLPSQPVSSAVADTSVRSRLPPAACRRLPLLRAVAAHLDSAES